MAKYHVAGKRTLVTGAANGLGRELCKQLSREGAEIIAVDIDAEGLSRLEQDLRTVAPVATYVCDLASADSIRQLAADVDLAHGGVDILVNNAGIVSGRPFLDIPDEWIERTFAVNTLAAIRLVRAFLPGMISRGDGHVVTISSAAGIAGTARMTDYAASKFAVFGFDEALRIELKQMGANVRTTVVCPFFFRSRMFPGVRSKVPWLLPVLEAEKVAARTVRAVRRGERRVILPAFIGFTFFARLLPVPVFDWISELLGVTRVMESVDETGEHSPARTPIPREREATP